MYFLLFMGGWGAVLPFINLFMARQGLSGTQIGGIIAAGAFFSLFAASFWTQLHVDSENPLAILAFTLIVSGLVTLLLGLQTAFLGIAIFYCLRMIFTAAHVTTGDLLALYVISGTQVCYGTIRFWGSLGWAIVVLITGWMNQKYSIRHGFFLYAALNLAAVFTLIAIREKPGGSAQARRNPLQYFKAIQDVSGLAPLLGINVLQLIISVGNLGIVNFETLYLNNLGAAEVLIGISCMVSSVVELPAMPLADRLIRKYGIRQMLLLALMINSIMRGLVLLLPGIWMIIVTRAVGGIAYSLLTVAIVESANRLSDRRHSGTALVVLAVIVPTVTSMLFSPLFGLLYDVFNTRFLYLVSLSGYLIAAFWLLWWKQPASSTPESCLK